LAAWGWGSGKKTASKGPTSLNIPGGSPEVREEKKRLSEGKSRGEKNLMKSMVATPW